MNIRIKEGLRKIKLKKKPIMNSIDMKRPWLRRLKIQNRVQDQIRSMLVKNVSHQVLFPDPNVSRSRMIFRIFRSFPKI